MADLITLEELADYLRVTKKTVYRLLDKHAIPSTRVGHQWRFDRAAVDQWLKQHSSGVAANILVIDDEEVICELFRETLEMAGHNVVTVTDAAAGLKLAVERDFNLVFIDLKMTGTDGVQTFKEIRASKPNLPVTIVTGFPDSQMMLDAMENGPFGIMKKPLSGPDILAVVRAYVHAGASSR